MTPPDLSAPPSRRGLLLSAAALAFAGLGARSALAAEGADILDQVRGYGPLRPDPAGVLDLPEGFSYRVLSTAGEVMDDGFMAPDHFDGMGCLPLPDGRLALLRNHELDVERRGQGPAGGQADLEARLDALPGFDRDAGGRRLPGGVTTLVIDPATGRRERQFLSLAGTVLNCAGGTTPWGSWLSCEETLVSAPKTGASHGWVFEVPATAQGPVAPAPLTAMGRFRHEAAAVDPATGAVYLTEDRDDGLLYRFLPRTPGAAGCRPWPSTAGPTAATGARPAWRPVRPARCAGSTWTPWTARRTTFASADIPQARPSSPGARACTWPCGRTVGPRSSSPAPPAGRAGWGRSSGWSPERPGAATPWNSSWSRRIHG